MRRKAAATQSVRERIEAQLPALSKKHRHIGEWVLTHPSAVLFGTVSDIAHRVDADAATVVRFVQGLGYAGFTEFRDALRSEIPALRTALERLDEEVSRDRPPGGGDPIEQVRSRTFSNLQQTFEALDRSIVQRAVNIALGANRVLVIGAGQSQVLAMHMHHVFQIAQIPSSLIADWYGLLYEAATLTARDGVFGMTFWRYSKVTIETLRVAKQAGARTVLLTDTPIAPGADFVDAVLLCAPQAVGEFLSPVAGAAVVDCLAAELVRRVPDRVARGIQRQDELAASHGIVY